MTPFEVDGSIKRVHDPAIIRGENAYYLYSTGAGIPTRQSPDLMNWETTFPLTVFPRTPAWALEMIPGANDVWAPDISFYWTRRVAHDRSSHI